MLGRPLAAAITSSCQQSDACVLLALLFTSIHCPVTAIEDTIVTPGPGFDYDYEDPNAGAPEAGVPEAEVPEAVQDSSGGGGGGAGVAGVEAADGADGMNGADGASGSATAAADQGSSSTSKVGIHHKHALHSDNRKCSSPQFIHGRGVFRFGLCFHVVCSFVVATSYPLSSQIGKVWVI